MNIIEFRKQYPEYNDISDQELANSLYQKHYSDMDRSLFDTNFLGKQAQPIAPQNQPTMTDPMAESMGMFSPTAAGRGAQMFAPEIGATVGGLLGSYIPVPGATPFMTGLGFAGGEAVKSGEVPSLDKFAQDFGQGTAMELAVKPITWAASKAFGPIKQAFSMLRAGQLANKGLPIPASSINPTEKGLQLAKKARETYPGNKIVKEAHDKLRTGADDMLVEFQNKFGVNEFTKEAADKAFEEWSMVMGGADAQVPLTRALSVIQDTLDKPFVTTAGPRDSSRWWLKEAQTFAQNPTVQGLRDIWSTIAGGKGADKTARQKLLDAIKTDIVEQYGDDVYKMLDTAKNQNNWAKKVSVLQGIIKRSHQTVDGVDTFLPDRFSREWLQSKNQFSVLKRFSKNEIADIDEFAQLMGVVGGELKQKVKDTGPASLLAQGGGLGGMAAGLNILGIPGSGLAAGGSIALPGIKYLTSRSAAGMYKPGSAMYRRTMGEPMAREMIPGLINIGGKLVLIEGEDLLK